MRHSRQRLAAEAPYHFPGSVRKSGHCPCYLIPFFIRIKGYCWIKRVQNKLRLLYEECFPRSPRRVNADGLASLNMVKQGDEPVKTYIPVEQVL